MKKKILYVDLHEQAIPVMVEWLTRKGYEVASATDVVQGYEKIKQEHFDVVLMDGTTNWPVKDGKNLSLIIKEEFPAILRICYTGTVLRDVMNQYMREFDAVVSRLGENDKLLELLQK